MGGAESKARHRTSRHSDRLADRPTSPGKPQLVPSDKHSAEPDVVHIRWEPPLYDGGSRITGYLVEHRRTGSPHWVRSSPNLVRVPELTLSGLEPGWRYQFRVSAQNAVGLSEPGELSDLLTVTLQRTAASAPFFVRELQDTTALENEKAELTVQVRGTPNPTIAWFKDGVEVFSSRSYRIVTDNETSTLVIHQAALSDEGEIKCSATNRVGYTVTRAKLVIQAPPSIRLPRQYEEGLLFEKDEVIRLKVSVAGRPVPEVSWALNGDPVPGGGRYEASHSERYATLRVGEARRSDRGEYTVRAVNKLGEDTASFLVTVADRPMAPGRAKVVMTLGRSVTLSWTSPEDDGGCKIGNYIVEYYRVGWNMWLKAATCRQLTTTLGDLIEGSEYKFRVKAENPYGVSEPSTESDVVFIPDPKRGLLEPPEHKPGETELPMDIWLENKKRAISPSPSPIDEQYGERKTKKKRGPLAIPASAQVQTKKEKHSMMSEDSLSPPPTPEDYPPTIPKRRGKQEKSEALEAQEERELSRRLEERRRVEEFKKLEETKKADEARKAEEERKASETKKVDEKKRRKVQQLPPQTPRLEHGRLNGSSELMLVLVPHSRATTEERETSKRELFESSMADEGSDIAPPMSLSAPELGSDGPPDPPPIRSAFSSSELLHDRAMARFYQDMAQEEAETSLRRRSSVQRRRSFERRPSTSKDVLNNAGSMQDILSATKATMRQKEEITKLEVIPAKAVLTKDKAGVAIPAVRSAKSFSKDSMDSMLSIEDVHRKVLVQQSSGEDMEYEDSSFDEDEEDEYDEEEEEITDEVVEEEEDEDLSNYENRGSLYTTSESEEEAQYSYSLDEESTYHPSAINIKYDEDTMISAYEGRGPLIVGSSSGTPGAQNLTPPEDFTDPASFSNNETKLKPILKRSVSDKNGTKPSERIENIQTTLNTPDYKPRSMASPEKRFEPNFSPVTLKPILKVRDPSQERLSPVSQRRGAAVEEVEPELSSANLDELSDIETGTKKKQVRIEEPGESLAKESRQEPLEDEVDAARVLISHYSDIVAEYSRHKRPPRRLYLDYEALKAAAEKEEEDLPVPEITIIEPMPEQPEPEQPKPEQPEPEQLEPELVHLPQPVPEQKPETQVIKQMKEHVLHFEPLVEVRVPKPEKIRDKSPSSLKKRSLSPRKRDRSVSKDRLKDHKKDKRKEEVILEKTELMRIPSPSMGPRRSSSTEKRVHSFFDFMMDLSLFLLACWLYLFRDERLAIPVLFLMIYRQAHEAFHRKMEALRNKIPRRLRFWRKD